jgi:Tol biopolymer transport system component
MRSELCIFDLASGEVQPLFGTDRLIEAPNWTPDGKSLLVNGEGRLYRIDLDDASDLVEIDTGFAQKLNNDHGISPNGEMLAISDATEEGQSCIYTVPFAGGMPTRITRDVPSYWHGWSPDGKTLAYVAKRGEGFDIYSCPVGGGEETRLTYGFDHCDGPDYTPDGAWIWFNGQKDDRMQIWRMRPDGSDAEQMTDDERVDWFPHPSPDGRHVLFLAYENGVQGHPRDHDVELRIMPADGGDPRVLCALFGGQGSINVPCWAPDSARFAFVRYTPVGKIDT